MCREERETQRPQFLGEGASPFFILRLYIRLRSSVPAAFYGTAKVCTVKSEKAEEVAGRFMECAIPRGARTARRNYIHKTNTLVRAAVQVYCLLIQQLLTALFNPRTLILFLTVPANGTANPSERPSTHSVRFYGQS